MIKSLQTLKPITDAPSLHAKCDKPSVVGFSFMEDEIWKDVKGLEGLYQISNHGKMRSLDFMSHIGNGKYRKIKGRVRKCSINPNGYVVNSIRGKTYFIHVEVAKAFIPNPFNKPEVNHLDGIKSNCHVSNLQWATRLENIEHAFKNRLIIPAVGQQQSNTVLTDDQVRYILSQKDKGPRELAREMKLKTHTIICSIRLGKTWNHISGLPKNDKVKGKFNL